jgi:hypothetical protein
MSSNFSLFNGRKFMFAPPPPHAVCALLTALSVIMSFAACNNDGDSDSGPGNSVLVISGVTAGSVAAGTNGVGIAVFPHDYTPLAASSLSAGNSNLLAGASLPPDAGGIIITPIEDSYVITARLYSDTEFKNPWKGDGNYNVWLKLTNSGNTVTYYKYASQVYIKNTVNISAGSFSSQTLAQN